MRASATCFWLERQFVRLAFSLALDNAGRSIPARIAMIAMTTSSSISLKTAVEDALRLRGGFESRRWV